MKFRYGNTYFACADQRQTKLKPQVELFKSNFHPSVKTLKHIQKNNRYHLFLCSHWLLWLSYYGSFGISTICEKVLLESLLLHSNLC